MRIAFDGTTLTPGRTGVGYYTEHLLQHLAREVEATGDELVVVSNKPVDTLSPLPSHVRVHEGHRFPIRIGWMQLRAARALESLKADVAHFTNGMIPLGSSTATVVTIHDLSLLLHSEVHEQKLVQRARWRLPLMAKAASKIITPSNSIKTEVCEALEVSPDKVVVTPEAPRAVFRRREDPELLRRLGIDRDFVLFVGTIEPRKNLRRLVDAFEKLLHSTSLSPKLMIAGGHG